MSDRTFESPIAVAAVMVHVADVAAARVWYERVFVGAKRRLVPESHGYECLQVGDVRIELVPADGKVTSGAAGSVVYWHVDDFDAALAHVQRCGAALYRGPMPIEDGQRMCQVRDPWGNCIGLRGIGGGDPG